MKERHHGEHSVPAERPDAGGVHIWSNRGCTRERQEAKMIDSNFVRELVRELTQLPKDPNVDTIESTRKELEGYNYFPLLTIDVPNFLSATRNDIVNFITRTVETRANEVKPVDLSLIVYHYRLLQKLRNNDPESWEQITELMDED
jgi:hypothetical protein